MKLNTQSHKSIEDTIKTAIDKFAIAGEQTFITDIYLQPCQSYGELCIFDDDDKLLAKTKVPEWSQYEGDDFMGDMERILRPIVHNLQAEGVFDNLSLVKPYSFVLVDLDYETIIDLYLMDEDTLMVDGGLLPDLDKELDEFLKELLDD